MTNIFEQIIQGKIPCDKVFENDNVLAFRDIAPQAPVHIIIVPKKNIKNIGSVSSNDAFILGELLVAAKKIAEQEGVIENFRLITNTGPESGQSVFHLHFHLLGGRPLGILG